MNLEKDIWVFTVEADSFPDGILDAHRRLHKAIPDKTPRRIFGLSRPENGVIRYVAAAEEHDPGEGTDLGCGRLCIQKGTYISETIVNYSTTPEQITAAFNRLLKDGRIDPQGYCVEWYFNDTDVYCMVRLK